MNRQFSAANSRLELLYTDNVIISEAYHLLSWNK